MGWFDYNPRGRNSRLKYNAENMKIFMFSRVRLQRIYCLVSRSRKSFEPPFSIHPPASTLLRETVLKIDLILAQSRFKVQMVHFSQCSAGVASEVKGKAEKSKYGHG